MRAKPVGAASLDKSLHSAPTTIERPRSVDLRRPFSLVACIISDEHFLVFILPFLDTLNGSFLVTLRK
jgi:hypothetical protein